MDQINIVTKYEKWYICFKCEVIGVFLHEILGEKWN
jgi:hypothetical protein